MTMTRANGWRALPWLLAFACATQPRAPIPRPYPPPTADELLRALTARQQALRSANLETRTTTLVNGERVRATVLMLLDRDGRLRFEAQVTLRGTVASLATNGKVFSMVDNEQRAMRHGVACTRNIAQLLPVPLTPQEVAALLLGDVLLPPDVQPSGIAWDNHLGADVLLLESQAKNAPWQRLAVTMRRRGTPPSYVVVAAEGVTAGSSSPWRVAFEDVGEGPTSLPGVIRFAQAGQSFDDGVEIKLKGDRIINPTLSDAAFVIDPPPGYRVEEVPCPR